MLNLVDLLEEELFAAEARRYDTEACPSAACLPFSIDNLKTLVGTDVLPNGYLEDTVGDEADGAVAWCMQVAADALVVTENELRGKLTAADEEIAEKRSLLADLNTRYDAVAAELAGAEANLSSADALLTGAKAHLALKESLLFEKETLIAALKKRTSAKSAAAPRFWQNFGRFRRAPGPVADQEQPPTSA